MPICARIPQTTLREGESSSVSLADANTSFPVEVFQLILYLYCQSFESPDGLDISMYDDSDDLIDTFPVFTLMRVCSAWRHIVLKTPEFWSVVSANDQPPALALARRWLSRAGNIPRTLTIKFRYDEYPITAVYDLISQFPFRTLRFKEYPTGRSVDFRKIRAESLLSLERLEFRGSYSASPYIGLTFPPHAPPNLSCLKINGSFQILHFNTISWPSLRQLDLSMLLSLSQSLTILRDATALERANMAVFLPDLPLAGGVVAANLSALQVNFGSAYDVGYFFDLLTAPKLKTLKVNNGCSQDFEMGCDISVFQRLVASSGIEMEELSIFWTKMPLSVGALLDCMPGLRRLELRTDLILDEDSTKRIANGELGPCLEALTMRLRLVDPEAATPILTMIESRQNSPRSESDRGHTCFKQVRIWVVGMGRRYTLRDYEQRLGKLKGIVEFN